MNNKDLFKKYKLDVLNKIDKSPKGYIDDKIKSLCDLINSREDMFTLSTCSGRICILEKNDGKKNSKWLFVTHDLIIDTKKIFKIIDNYESNGFLEFRQESVIMHIVVKDFEVASFLMNIAKISGFNKVGIIAFKKKIVIELICDIDLVIPIYDLNDNNSNSENNKLQRNKLIEDNFLNYLILRANSNLEKSWNIIKKIENNLAKY